MKMGLKFDRISCLKSIVIILVLNYMVITIIFNDATVLKYLRDILLVGLLSFCIIKNRMKFKETDIIILLFILMLGVAFVNTIISGGGFVIAFKAVRRYIFPLGVFIAISHIGDVSKKRWISFIKFIMVFIGIVSLWGIFQAYILGDTFLMNLGYNTGYSYAYKKVMLASSFYFGNLGIQRVVSTISNSNVCGLIFGLSFVFLIMCYSEIKNRYKNIFLLIIFAGYILTFSRSNFVALGVIVLWKLWTYIPYKKWILSVGGILILACAGLGIIQGEDGIIYKLINWVMESLTFKESSAAGRSSIWLQAIDKIAEKPLGNGFGMVGSLAREAGVTNYLHCENSYLALAVDCGIHGLIIYLIIFYSLFKRLAERKKTFKYSGNTSYSNICIAGQGLIIYFLIAMFFSNYIYDMEAVTMLYMFIGVGLNLPLDDSIEKSDK